MACDHKFKLIKHCQRVYFECALWGATIPGGWSIKTQSSSSKPARRAGSQELVMAPSTTPGTSDVKWQPGNERLIDKQ